MEYSVFAALGGERHSRGILKIGNRIEEPGAFALNDLRQSLRDKSFLVGGRRGKTNLKHLKCLQGRHVRRALGENAVACI